jgi:2-polyprenyl-6-methoxyphenol hydroxylase-like FAD-dependent oxidoreductase
MLSKNDMRIVIVGGSVAGLTLANILEQIGIDYILLEKYASIAPDLGASIATFPNGGRILDQIGCYDKIAELIEDGSSNQHMCMRSPDGKKFLEILNLNDILTSRCATGHIQPAFDANADTIRTSGLGTKLYSSSDSSSSKFFMTT